MLEDEAASPDVLRPAKEAHEGRSTSSASENSKSDNADVSASDMANPDENESGSTSDGDSSSNSDSSSSSSSSFSGYPAEHVSELPDSSEHVSVEIKVTEKTVDSVPSHSAYSDDDETPITVRASKRARIETSSSAGHEGTDADGEEHLSGNEGSVNSGGRRGGAVGGRRRRLSDDMLELLEKDPELLGIRRSHRQRKETQRYTKEDEPSTHKKTIRVIRRLSDDNSSNGYSDDHSRQRVTKKTKRKESLRVSIKRKPSKAAKRSRNLSSDEDDEDESTSSESEESRNFRGVRRGAKVNYREPSVDEATASDDLLEPTDDLAVEEAKDDRDSIEKIMKHRIAKKGASGPATTKYNCEDKGDPNADFVPTEENPGETQYLIKWIGWSHLHNTWESEENLVTNNVKGLKKLENYQKRQSEINAWRKTADKDYIEYFECEQEMSEELFEQYLQVERIIGHSKNPDRPEGIDYFVKWCGLPYAEATWEVDSLVGRWFQPKIDEYYTRVNSACLPNKHCRALRQKPKFVQLKTQPDYVGGGPEHFPLRDYQLDGLNWLVNAWCRSNSVILADEMGLGKTIQTIAFLSHLFHAHSLYGPFLIVVPLSTLASWQKEFEMWAPDMNVIVYIGDVTSRNIIRQHEWCKTEKSKLKFNCVITTYEILLKDKAFLGATEWAVLAVDEAHRLKNDEALLYRSLFEFSTNHRLLITGTPLQNSLKELWALLHFINPEKFDSWEEFEDAHHASEVKGYASLHKELEPYILRRVKKDVEKSLPAKVEQILRVDMSSMQKEYYKYVLKLKLILTKNYGALSKGVKGSISGFLNVMMELKKCCNHPHLIRLPDQEESGSMDARLNQLIKVSGKLILLDKLLVRLQQLGHRVLIFSQMVMMLDILEDYMRLRKFNFQRLDGSIRGDVRKQAIDHFNAEGSLDFCFLLSTRAGGLGINLATADTVIIFDSDWNPQNDLQAQSRAHRIGQTKQVNIYRLVTRASVEEEIVERAKRKLVLDHLVIQRMDTTGRTVLAKNAVSNSMPFNKEELNAILKFGAEELFKEKEGEETEPEVDIDLILQRAETREMETAAVGDDLLSQFKVANFAIDEDSMEMPPSQSDALKGDVVEKSWDDIIPEEQRRRIEEEERLELEKELAPRSRNRQVQKMARNEDSDEDDWSSRDRKRKRGGDSDSAEESSDDEEKPRSKRQKKLALHGFTEAEVRRFVRSYRKFPQPMQRLEAIACDAELEEHSKKELQLLANVLEIGCHTAVEEYTLSSLQSNGGDQKENSADGDDNKKKDRGPVCKLGGVEFQVKPLLKSQADLEALAAVIPLDFQERRRFKIPGGVKPLKTWDVEWTEDDDAALLRGIYEYGFGSWERIKMDPDLALVEKILPVDKIKKPQTKHLVTRAEYLLRVLQKRVELASGGARSKLARKLLASSATKVEGAAVSEKKEKSKRKPKATADSEIAGNLAKSLEDRKLRQKKEKPTKDAKAVSKSPVKQPPPIVPVLKLDGLTVNLELETRLDGDVFKECKESMRPLKEKLRLLNEDKKSEEFTTALLKIGDRIGHCLVSKNDKDLLRDWHSFYWLFASKFTELNGEELHKLYKKKAKSRGKKESKTENAVPSSEAKEGEESPRKAKSEKHKHKHRERGEGKGKAKAEQTAAAQPAAPTPANPIVPPPPTASSEKPPTAPTKPKQRVPNNTPATADSGFVISSPLMRKERSTNDRGGENSSYSGYYSNNSNSRDQHYSQQQQQHPITTIVDNRYQSSSTYASGGSGDNSRYRGQGRDRGRDYSSGRDHRRDRDPDYYRQSSSYSYSSGSGGYQSNSSSRDRDSRGGGDRDRSSQYYPSSSADTAMSYQPLNSGGTADFNSKLIRKAYAERPGLLATPAVVGGNSGNSSNNVVVAPNSSTGPQSFPLPKYESPQL